MASKKSLGMDVYVATMQRLELIFDKFDNIYLSFSAGKDSSVMIQLAMQVARKYNKKFGILLLDLESQYDATINHALEIIDNNLDILEPYWVALPLHLRNAVSVFEPNRKCWDEEKKDIRVRQRPDRPYVISDPNYFPFFRDGMEFEEFVPLFGKRYAKMKKAVFTACMVGIRADESLNRYRTLITDKKIRFEGKSRSTKIRSAEPYQLYNFYPMYDWKTEDIRTAVGKLGLKRNKIYDKMYLRGKSIHDMRICQPYGDDQRKGLDLFQECEPETRDRVLKRVSGVNYGAIYRGQRVLGNYKVNLPKGHTYKSYSIYLLSTLPKPIRIHYLRRIAVFINWHRMKEGYTIIPDFANEKEEASKKKPSRRRICKAILKNDYYCKSLSFTMNTFEFETLIEIEKKCIIKEKIEEKDNGEFLYTIKIQKDNNVIKGITLWSGKKPKQEGDYLVYEILL